MTLNNDFFQIKHKLASTKKGSVLVSEPFSKDIYFKRSVVLLTEHTSEGSIGFILNKPVEMQVNDVLKNFPPTNARMLIGGPVSTDTVHFIHTLGEKLPDSIHVFDNIYWGGDFEKLKLLFEAGAVSEDEILFFMGYSGWSPNQLEDEIKQNFWIVTEVPSDMVMKQERKNFWKNALDALGSQYKIWANAPENPEMN